MAELRKRRFLKDNPDASHAKSFIKPEYQYLKYLTPEERGAVYAKMGFTSPGTQAGVATDDDDTNLKKFLMWVGKKALTHALMEVVTSTLGMPGLGTMLANGI
jgi:hypothetical protein